MRETLKYRDDGSFKILQLTDLHLSEGMEPDRKTHALIKKILELEKPDLAVLTGDIIAGAGNECADSAAAWRLALGPLEEAGIPFAPVFGNHDDEGGLKRPQMTREFANYKMSLAEAGPAELAGSGNYVLEMEDGRPLFFLDSLGAGPKEVSPYAWISTGQVDWFRRSAAQLKGPAGLAFFHIPLPEYEQAWHLGGCKGEKHEEVCCPKVNSGLFTAMLESKAVKGVFVGHDHVNDYEADLHGIALVYGRCGGYNCYGREGFLRGARLIQIRRGEAGFETWQRLEDGSLLRY